VFANFRSSEDNLCQHIEEHFASPRIIARHGERFLLTKTAIIPILMEVVGRRSRTRRTPGRNRIALTIRDIEIFKLLTGYRYLRSTYLDGFLGGASEKRFIERLGNLFHQGYLDRPEQQWEFAHALCQPAVYEIGEGGRRVLSECGEVADAMRTFPNGHGQRQFKHTLAICDVLASIEISAVGTKNVRFIPWSEILTRAPESTRLSPTPGRIPVPGTDELSPDALFGLEYTDKGRCFYRFFALEIDRATMPVRRTNRSQYSFGQKLERYIRMLRARSYKSHLGISKLFVLTVTLNATHMLAMMNQLRGLDVRGSFLFRPIDFSVASKALLHPNPGLLAEPWQRPDLPALTICSP